jgi:acyl-coenzyme A thioesterase PaaI-like protein|tara:strand:+ start:144 stop:551 length:408 start_codon:yes stop_codon:yes gene_type:complete
MKKKFKQISIKPGFMKHNGGLLFRKKSKNEFEFKTTIKKNHLNKAGIAHGGYIASIIDTGAGASAHRVSNNRTCVTISLDIKFISITNIGDEILGYTKIQKKTNSLVFLICHLYCKKKIIASASGVWKMLGKPIN